LISTGCAIKALEHYQVAIDLWRRLAAGNPAYGGEVATTLILIGIILEKQGDLPEALERFREALSLRQQEADIERSTQREWQAALAFSHARAWARCWGCKTTWTGLWYRTAAAWRFCGR
jgi:tetratricopeptide (TPR) repeat protein